MLSLVTMNIRYPAPSDGMHYFPFRLPYIAEKIKEAQPDFMCFQEMLPFMHEALASMLPEYVFIGIGREADLTGEACRIAYKKSAFILCAEDTFWLSPIPNLPGSRYEDQSICPRVCTWGKFYHRDSKKMLYIMNTHLDHEGDGARKAGLKQILKQADALLARQSIPLFLTGDFNFTPADSAYQLIAASALEDITASIDGSFHDYGKLENQKIDYILTNQPADQFEIEKWHKGSNHAYLSDHDFICAKWKNF